MPVAAYTNFDISNVYKGNNNVSRIMKGNVHAWPPSPAFSFSTYRSGGDLNFTVTSDTDYIACTVNDSDVFIYKTSGTTANNIYTYGTLHQLESAGKVIDVSLPLYERKYARISGAGTQLARYGHDYNNGRVVIEIVNQFGSNISYTVNLTGKGSITKTCPVGTITSFIFTSVPKGTRTVTLTDLSDGSTTSTQVVINTNSAPISMQNLALGLNKADNSTGNILNNIKVYSITDEEALNSIHGTAPIISVQQFSDGFAWRGSSFAYNRMYREWFHRLKFRIISGGAGLPVNSEIQVRWDQYVRIKRSGSFKTALVYYHILTLVTDSVGRVVRLKEGTGYQGAIPSGWSMLENWTHPTQSRISRSRGWQAHNHSSMTASVSRITGISTGNNVDDAASFKTNWIEGGSAGINFIGTDKPIYLVTYSKYENINTFSGIWT